MYMTTGTICFLRNKKLAVYDKGKIGDVSLSEYNGKNHRSDNALDIVYLIRPPMKFYAATPEAFDDLRGYEEYYNYFLSKFLQNEDWRDENGEFL